MAMGDTKKQALVSSGSRPEHIQGGLGPSTLRTGPRVGCQQVTFPLALELPHPLISIQRSTGDGDAHHHPATSDWLGTVKPSSLLASRSQTWVSVATNDFPSNAEGRASGRGPSPPQLLASHSPKPLSSSLALCGCPTSTPSWHVFLRPAGAEFVPRAVPLRSSGLLSLKSRTPTPFSGQRLLDAPHTFYAPANYCLWVRTSSRAG